MLPNAMEKYSVDCCEPTSCNRKHLPSNSVLNISCRRTVTASCLKRYWLYRIIVKVFISLLGFQSFSEFVKIADAIQVKTPSSAVVTTKYGNVRGIIVSFPNRNIQPVEVFMGIPYASPPTGKLRFMPPVTPASWQGIRLAEMPGPVCIQNFPNLTNRNESWFRMTENRFNFLVRIHSLTFNQSEDCLYLNIYSPTAYLTQASSSKLSVLVFIHGESYEWNSGSNYDGSVLASLGNIIVVTINFRLGVLGFFATPDGPSRGNYGLMDQVAALHWIQENIAFFGGDPANVTIFGHGYGAAFVNLLMISPMAKGLFQRAIMQSGSALCPWALASDGVKYSRLLAQSLGCLNDIRSGRTEANIECLRQIPAQDLISSKVQIPTFLTGFGPTLDGIVVPTDLSTLMTETNSLFGSYDLLFGVTKPDSDEFSDDENLMDLSRRDRIIKTLVRNLFTHHLHEIFLTIVNEYTDWSRPASNQVTLLESVTDILSDALFVAPTIKAGLFHSKFKRKDTSSPARTYLFNFLHFVEKSDQRWKLGINGSKYGHGKDLSYVFGAPLLSGTGIGLSTGNYSKLDQSISETMIKYWSSFAKFGDPNIGASIVQSSMGKAKLDKIWLQYEEETQHYLTISSKPKSKDHFQSHRLSYWLNLFPKLDRADSSAFNRHFLKDYENPETFEGVIRENFVSEMNWSSAEKEPKVFGYNGSSSSPSSNMHLNTGVSSTEDDLETFMNGSFSMIVQESSYSTALELTMAIGCFLLVLNILVFAGVFYHRDCCSGPSESNKAKKVTTKSVSNESRGLLKATEKCNITAPVNSYCGRHCVATIKTLNSDNLSNEPETCDSHCASQCDSQFDCGCPNIYGCIQESNPQTTSSFSYSCPIVQCSCNCQDFPGPKHKT